MKTLTTEQFKSAFHNTILACCTETPVAKPYVSKRPAPRKLNVSGLVASLERGIK